MMNPYYEDALVEHPAIALFKQLDWETANCFSVPSAALHLAPLLAADGCQVLVAPAYDLVQEDAPVL